MSEILDEIFANQDTAYRDFHSKLVPGVEKLIGLRAPIAKKIAKKYANTATGKAFLNDLPHTYYEENLVHGYMLGYLKDGTRERLEAFLPYVDNWGVCDSMTTNLKNLFVDASDMLGFVKSCLKSEKTYTVRFGLVSLICYYIDREHIDFVLSEARKIKSEEYYIKMANAWLISMCLARQYERTLPTLQNEELDAWTHNKAIQKAIESYQVSPEQKNYLRSLKRK